MKFEFIEAEKANFPVAFICRHLNVSRSGFYAWRNRPESERTKADRELLTEIKSIYEKSRQTYGSPRVYEDLRESGKRVSRKRVARLMRSANIRARRKRKFIATTDSKHNLPIAPNLLARDFEPDAPNRSWASDITYIWTLEGWLYLAVVMDLFSRKVVGWSMSKKVDRKLVLASLAMALANREVTPGLVHHSDRGSQYASEDHRKALEANGIVCSMSRKGDCWDNAVVESFFGTLKNELIHRERFETREQARLAVFEFIEVFYNRQRRHSRLGYVSPVEFEEAMATRMLLVA